MTSPSRRRWIAPSLALVLAAGFVGASTVPASAASSTFSNDSRTYLGDGATQTYSSTGSLTIPDSGTATPYPSQITVPHDATIADLNVQLTGLTHTNTFDLDVLLVGPHGQQVVLTSDAGGPAANVNLTFDDSALDSMNSSYAAVTSGTYKPTNLAGTDIWPAPAPASTNNTSLATFDGTSAGGVWSLYVNDDLTVDMGTLASWELDFEFVTRPYPSTVSVTGLPAISDVNVTLGGFDSEYLDDVELLLVGPGGQQSILMSDVGGSNMAANATYVIDDEAPAAFPDGDPIPSGSYQPTNIGGGDSWPSPAPDASGNVSLSVFDGISPNGDWNLYADDCCGDDLTSIGSWSLQFTWADTQNPSGSVTINGGAASVAGTAVTLALTATDPAPATGVKEMRFSNDGVTFSAYQPFAPTAPWTLGSDDGVKTVYAQFRDGDGNQSSVVTDTITLAGPDVTAPTVKKTTPKKNAKGVKVTTKVKVKVSEALKGSTVTKKAVFLKAKGSSNKVKAKVTYNSSKKMMVLTPNKALKKNKKYNVTVTTKVKDLAGNGFDAKPGKSGAQALKFSFTTA